MSKEEQESAFNKISTEQSAAIRKEMLKRECIKPEVQNDLGGTFENNSNSPTIDIFLNPDRSSEKENIINLMKKRAEDYFKTADMRKLYPELFQVLWHYTLPCVPQPGMEHSLLRRCSVGNDKIPCQDLFRRVPTDSGVSNSYCHLFTLRNVLCPELRNCLQEYKFWRFSIRSTE